VRIVDLDRDMTHVIPTGTSVDSEFLFRRMEEATFEGLGDPSQRWLADVAAGVGQDGRTLVGRGASVVGAEPSRRMTDLARLETLPGSQLRWVRAWSEALPFRDASFDGAFCKGSLDHFDDPEACIAETARVTRPEGHVVFAVANFGSLGCRIMERVDRLALRWKDRSSAGRRHYDVPSDHFTRYDPELLRSQLERHLVIESWVGISLLWGVRGWAALLGRLPKRVAGALLSMADRAARWFPAQADVIVATGRPRDPPVSS
jgi:SAM-dependent methyltransferase